MSNKSRNLKRIISTLCSLAAVTGAGAKDVSESSKGNTNRPVVSSSSVKRNDQSFVGNVIDKIQRNKGKSLAIGAGIAAGVGGAAYGIKKIVDKNKENKNKEKPAPRAVDTNFTASNAQVSDVQVNNAQASNTNTNQVSTPQYSYLSAQGLRLTSNKLLQTRRDFKQTTSNNLRDRDGNVANRLKELGFNLDLGESNCKVFDLVNSSYTFYVFDYNDDIPEGAGPFVRKINDTNVCYTLAKGGFFAGTDLIKPDLRDISVVKTDDPSVYKFSASRL